MFNNGIKLSIIAEELRLNEVTIRRYIKRGLRIGKVHENPFRTALREVKQYDKNGNFIAQFESIKLAATILKLDKSSIGHVCAKDRRGCNTCGGFIFKYADKEEIVCEV